MNMKRTIASMLTLALMTGYGAPLAAAALADEEEDLAWALIIAAMLDEEEKQQKKSKKKSSSKKSTSKKSTSKKTTTTKSTTKKSSSSSSSAPAYTLSEVTPYSGVVRTNGGSLNMRKNASADSDLVMSLANGTFVTVNGKTSNGWLRVNVGNQTGFVASRYITEMIEASAIPAPTETPASAGAVASTEAAAPAQAAATEALYYVIANPLNNFVNMRQGTGTSTPVIGVYHYGAVLKVIAIEGDWSKVEDESNGKVGYIKSTQLQRTDIESDEDHG